MKIGRGPHGAVNQPATGRSRAKCGNVDTHGLGRSQLRCDAAIAMAPKTASAELTLAQKADLEKSGMGQNEATASLCAVRKTTSSFP